VGHDIDQELLAWIPKLDATLLSSERSTIQRLLENGTDPNDITPKHLNAIQKAKRVIRALMLGSPEKMLKAAEFVQGFTDAQIDNFFTQSQRVRIRTRQNYILDNQSVFNGDQREELNG
jgi:hypothetical protein